ncbi:MAG: glycoside hydrolase family 88 protein [Bacteroidales bacterium]|nr:glycoside hydrolase family 88 protein [Bacteroidales bacterium]MBN2633399.1 glycoside hydrolase family 88 protein [Bacteroidales bacterium]
MKKNLLLFSLISLLLISCGEQPIDKVIDRSLNVSMEQYMKMYDVMKENPGLLPRTLDTAGQLITARPNWWTSGFFPGSLWYLYEYSKDDRFKEAAAEMTSRIEKEKNNKGTHDLGFMLYCSFGNGFRLTAEKSYADIMLTGAGSLATRYRPKIGCIQSWNSRRGWQCPVIIDNMMNLEFLMWAFKESGDSTFYNICVNHSDTTIKNHFRPDFSSYHVVSYDTASGKVEIKQTHQGYSDESAWARGQAWGLYGYVVMYRETGFERYLNQAVSIADFLINHPNMPEDKIPYWDFNAPDIPEALRDASAGSIIASALIELSGYVSAEKGSEYLKVAETQIRTLSSDEYLAKTGENGNFILKHGVGHLPGNSEVDVPLTYGDYYYIEAMLRYRALPGK